MILVNATFLQDIHVSLQSNPLVLKLKDHYKILIARDNQAMESQLLDSEVVDSKSLDHSAPYSRIHRSHRGEMRHAPR